jgi:DNA-binding MarR family transcriptional regulator
MAVRLEQLVAPLVLVRWPRVAMICVAAIDCMYQIVVDCPYSFGVSDLDGSGELKSPDNLVGVLMDYLLRRLRAEADRDQLPHGMKSRHAIVLTLLRDFGDQAQSDLPQAVGLDATGVVALLNRLESEGLIERRRATEDRRRHNVSITDAGRRRLVEIEQVAAQLEQRLLGLKTKELAALHRLLAKATANVASGPAETVPET